MTKDKDRTPVAQNVITKCTKCDMELNHVVVANNAAGIVEKVKCLNRSTLNSIRHLLQRLKRRHIMSSYCTGNISSLKESLISWRMTFWSKS
jgi:hypothetical protein